MIDLVALVADKDAKEGLTALLKRRDELRTRPFTYNVYAHPDHDPAVLRRSHEFLREFLRSHSRALVMFDREGCGWDDADVSALRDHVQQNLDRNGWKDRSAVVVIDPELEKWIWCDHRGLAQALGVDHCRLTALISSTQCDIYGKPVDPKECLLEVLRATGVRVSSSLFSGIAEVADFSRCSDPAFLSLLRALQSWFPRQPTPRGGSR